MIDMLMYIANGLIAFGIVGYFLLVIISRKDKVTKSDGFNVTKDILHEYDSINIVENTGIFTIYNIKRKVIKIASKCYYGNSVSDIGIPLIEAGVSVDGKSKYIDFFKKIISNLKILYLLSIIAIFINSITYNIGDARIGIILVFVFSFISYILIDIKSNSVLWISKNIGKIKDINKDKIVRFMNNILLFDKLIFLGELVVIIRFVGILLNF